MSGSSFGRLPTTRRHRTPPRFSKPSRRIGFATRRRRGGSRRAGVDSGTGQAHPLRSHQRQAAHRGAVDVERVARPGGRVVVARAEPAGCPDSGTGQARPLRRRYLRVRNPLNPWSNRRGDSCGRPRRYFPMPRQRDGTSPSPTAVVARRFSSQALPFQERDHQLDAFRRFLELQEVPGTRNEVVVEAG